MENVGPNSYTTSELISIELYDLVKEYSIPRDAYRKLVRLMNTTIRDNDKLARESNPQIMHGPQVEKMMQQQTTLSAHSYDVCENGCKLYNLEDEATECQYCSHDRFDSRNSNKPFQTMKIMSIGDIVSGLIANPVTREELRYRHNLDAGHHDDDEQPDDEIDRIFIRDVFDADDYQRIRSTHFTNEHDIGICIQNDGFVIDKRGSRLFAIIHVLILNYSPNLRYKNEYSIQLCILPGKKKPASFSSYLSLILAEIQWLSTHGMVVNTPDNLSIRLRVHCVVAGGDIPGKSIQNW
ncbi:hypothetical protein [Parasitella parasitica]|uniref:Uncharacterized protein n=1 Tax=Parasitella parasitica TaxID=35722 RepID=A0A0B7NM92_9FUNG|nr:hypothetical protein [Parasitella parasitica]